MASGVAIVRLFWLGLVAAGSGVAAAEPPASADAATAVPAVSPAARAVLDRMTKYLGSLDRFSIVADESRDALMLHGYKLQQQQRSTLWVERPDRLRVEVDGDIKRRTYVYDGRTLTVHAPRAGVYAQIDAPPTIKATVDTLLARGIEMPLIDVLVQAFAGTLAEEVVVGRLIGKTHIDGVAVDHLAFRQPTIDWQLWVDQGERPLPRKLLITTRYEVGDPQYEATLAWDLASKAPADAFAFAPPAGSRRIELADAPGESP
jgi:hypothetical protein